MKKSKILISIMSLCFALATLTFGVFAANSATYTLSGIMSYVVTDAFVKVETKIYTTQNLTLGNMYSRIEELTAGNTSNVNEFNTIDLSYNSLTENKASATKSLQINFTSQKK